MLKKSEKPVNRYEKLQQELNEYYNSTARNKKWNPAWNQISNYFPTVENCCALTETSGWESIEDVKEYMEWYCRREMDDCGAYFWTGQVKGQAEVVEKLLKAGWKKILDFKSRQDGQALVMLAWKPEKK